MKGKSSDLSNIERFWGVFVIAISLLAVNCLDMILIDKAYGRLYEGFYFLYTLFILSAIGLTTIIMFLLFFNSWKEFNSDTLYIFSSYILLESFLLVCIHILSTKYRVFGNYVHEIFHYSLSLFLVNALYFWIIYYWRCLETIKELNKDKYIFFASSAKLILGAILVWCSSTKIIESFDEDINTVYYIINILVNFCYPLIGMYTCVCSEINKSNEQKYEMDKKELQTIKKEIEMMKNEINRKTAKIEYKITHYKNK